MTKFMHEECPRCSRDVAPAEVTGDPLTPTPNRDVIYGCVCGAAWRRTLTDSEVDAFARLAAEARCRGLTPG